MKTWWRRWVWVRRRDRWRGVFPPVPLPMWLIDDIIREHYVGPMRRELNRTLSWIPLWECPWCGPEHPLEFCPSANRDLL